MAVWGFPLAIFHSRIQWKHLHIDKMHTEKFRFQVSATCSLVVYVFGGIEMPSWFNRELDQDGYAWYFPLSFSTRPWLWVMYAAMPFRRKFGWRNGWWVNVLGVLSVFCGPCGVCCLYRVLWNTRVWSYFTSPSAVAMWHCLEIIDASRKCSIHGDTYNVLKTRCVSRKNSIHFAQMCYDVFYCVMM